MSTIQPLGVNSSAPRIVFTGRIVSWYADNSASQHDGGTVFLMIPRKSTEADRRETIRPFSHDATRTPASRHHLATPPKPLQSVASVIAHLAVITLGLSAGAMLAEGAILVPYWRSLPPASFLQWYAANAALLLDFFAPLETGSGVCVVVAAALYQYQRRRGRGLLTTAAVLAVAVLAFFPLYFQSVNASFAAGTIGLDHVAAELSTWALWHWFRIALGVSAFVAALLGSNRWT